MANFSFDIVSEINRQELVNAIDQVKKEVANRYDFKGIDINIKLEDEFLTLLVPDEFKLKALLEIIQSKILRRGLSLKILGEQKQESASGGSLRVIIKLIAGIDQEKAKKINKIISEEMPKIKTQIQGEAIRVVSNSKNELQVIIQLLKDNPNIDLPLQFTNFR